MKKGLLGLLVVALAVVGCQNYDDQFDDLNTKISNLSTSVSNLESVQSAVTALGTKLDALSGSALTDADLTKILAEVAAVKAEVANIKSTDVSSIETEVDGINAEIDQILEKLGDLLAASAFYEGNLVIKNLGQLANAHEMVKTGADDPTITVKGNVDVVVGTGGVTKDSIASVNLILAKIRSIQGTATVTTDANAVLGALTYVTGGVAFNGTSGKANVTASKLLTVDGSMTITGVTGALSFPSLGSVAAITITEVSGKATVTSIDFSALTAGKVLTGTDSLVLAGATSVKLGGVLPSVVTLAKCTEFVHGGGAAQPALDLTLGGKSATFSLAATSFTGEVTITTTGNINLPSVTKIKKTTLKGSTAASEAHLPALTEVDGDLLIDSKFTTVDLDKLATLKGDLTIQGEVVVSLPALAKLTTSVVTITCAAAKTFSAPKLDTGNASGTVIDLAAAVDHINLLNLADTTTPTNDVVEWAAIKKIELNAQKGDLDVSGATALVDLLFTGFKNTPVGEDKQTNILTITGTNANLKTLVIGATSALKTLNVTTTTLTDLTTAGAIINCYVTNNTALKTFNFGHTHLQGDRESRVDVTNNDNASFTALDMSSLSKVGAVTVKGNAKLASIVAPSTEVLATSLATITVSISGNNLTGTYKPATAPTGTVTYVAPAITNATLASFKTWIEANVNVDVAAPIGTKDRTFAAAGNAAYALNTATGPAHGGVTGNAVIFDIDLDNTDEVGTTAVETGDLSDLMNADTAAKAGASGGAADDDCDNAGGVTSHRELALVAAQ